MVEESDCEIALTKPRNRVHASDGIHSLVNISDAGLICATRWSGRPHWITLYIKGRQLQELPGNWTWTLAILLRTRQLSLHPPHWLNIHYASRCPHVPYMQQYALATANTQTTPAPPTQHIGLQTR
jgi:hypothetical protein